MRIKPLKPLNKKPRALQRTSSQASVLAIPLCAFLYTSSALAQLTPSDVPGAADIGRVYTPDLSGPKFEVPTGVEIPESIGVVNAPAGSESIFVTLKSVKIEGVEVFTPGELEGTYKEYLGKRVSLDTVWKIAADITAKYRDRRYFLSRAYVPAQEVEDGNITIRVVEGYVGNIIWQREKDQDNRIIRAMSEALVTQKPLTTDAMESYLLRVNDMPGYAYRAVMQPMENGDEGAVNLVMVQQEKSGQGQVRVDNAGSRFLGPYQIIASYQDSLIKGQNTLLSASSSLPPDELKYIAFAHQVPVAPKWSVDFTGSYIRANPGYTLEATEIESKSAELGVGITYQPIRQWLKNLSLGLHFTGKDTDSDILNTVLTRDRVRVIRANVAYDTADFFDGYSYWNATVSQGIEVFGSSSAGDADISRPQAEPDFTKIELTYTRQQPVTDNFLLIGKFASQLASGPLYSSEEFGYGGQAFGRAYDPSEITGDHGVAAGVELRYTNFEFLQDYEITPFIFYDFGKVWNDDTGGENISGSSAGAGVYFNFPYGISAGLTAAQPLTKSIDNPLYGNGEKAPRLVFDLTYRF